MFPRWNFFRHSLRKLSFSLILINLLKKFLAYRRSSSYSFTCSLVSLSSTFFFLSYRSLLSLSLHDFIFFSLLDEIAV